MGVMPWESNRRLTGAITAEKLRGTKVWVLTPGRLRPVPGQRPRWVLGAGGVAPSRCASPGYHPQKFCEHSDVKLCILVTTCCEISCFLKTTANLKVGGPVSPVPTVVAPMRRLG